MPHNIERLLGEDEGQSLEFKTSFAEQEDIIDTLVAFANAQGGTVIVGVTPDHRIVGAGVGDNTRERFSVRLRDKTGGIPGLKFEESLCRDSIIVAIDVPTHRAGQLFVSGGTAFVRVGNTNQKMTAAQIRERILDDPEVSTGRPRFDIGSPSVRNPSDEPYVHFTRNVYQVDGEALESLEWRVRGPVASADWERVRIVRSYRQPTATMAWSVARFTSPTTDAEVPDGQVWVELRFRWRGEVWHERHRFPITGWDVGREILPSLCRREDADWFEAS